MAKSLAPKQTATPHAATSDGPSIASRGRGGAQAKLGNAEVAGRLGVNDGVPFLEEMESAFGEDFSDVKVKFAPGTLSDMDAEGAADGDTITLPGPGAAKELVAHELAHVVQRRKRGAGAAEVSEPGEAAEKEADAAAARAAKGGRVGVSQKPGARTMRKAVKGGKKYNVDPKEKNEHPGETSYGEEDYTRIEKTPYGKDITIQNDTWLYDNLGNQRQQVKKGQEARLNAGQRRDVKIGGAEVPCLLVFSIKDANSSRKRTGWIPERDLPGSVAKKSWNPTISGGKVEVTDDEYEVLDKSVPDEHESRYVYPKQDGGENKAKFYYANDGVVNFLLNLPHTGGGRYGSARDVLAPGTKFKRAKKESVKIPVYAKNGTKAVDSITFVYGRTANRYGWINHECLKKTS